MLIKKFWKFYPKSKGRNNISKKKIYLDKKKKLEISKFGKKYFDGPREYGYGGYYYNKKFFRKIAKILIQHYKLNNKSKILDIGCAKGFLMFEIKRYLPKAEVWGVDISKYCKKNALPSIKKYIKVCSCINLPFKKEYFDFVISISTIHNLKLNGIIKSIKEINRVSKEKSFIRVKAYRNNKEKKFIEDWNIVAKSNLSRKKWLKIFSTYKYKGDYDFSNF